MKKALIAALAAATLLAGCGNDKIIDGVNYETYGFANEEARKNPKIIYEVSVGSVIVAIIFCETIIVPVYVIGWDLMQPVKTRPVTP